MPERHALTTEEPSSTPAWHGPWQHFITSGQDWRMNFVVRKCTVRGARTHTCSVHTRVNALRSAREIGPQKTTVQNQPVAASLGSADSRADPPVRAGPPGPALRPTKSAQGRSHRPGRPAAVAAIYFVASPRSPCPVRFPRTTRIHSLETPSPSPCRTASGYRLW
jgi:hypothetical protein